MDIARVAVFLPLPKLYDYALSSGEIAMPGQRRILPFNNRKIMGVIVAIKRADKKQWEGWPHLFDNSPLGMMKSAPVEMGENANMVPANDQGGATIKWENDGASLANIQSGEATENKEDFAPFSGAMLNIGPPLENFSFFSPNIMELTRFLADYYMTSWGDILRAACYSLKVPASKNISYVQVAISQEELKAQKLVASQKLAIEYIKQRGKIPLADGINIPGCGASTVQRLIKRGILSINRELATLPPKKEVAKFEGNIKITPNEQQKMAIAQIIKALENCQNLEKKTVEDWEKIQNCENCQNLEKKAVEDWEKAKNCEDGENKNNKAVENWEKAKVCEDGQNWHKKRGNVVFSLQGITGSGKTEIYIQALKKVLELGKQGIVLVPEISLTPQAIARYKERFGDQISILHSRMTNNHRYREYIRILSGNSNIIVGTRSAIFAPCPNLGLIVMDEEGERAYCQEENFRYHARFVAVKRGELENCPVILGSATPSAETWHNAQTGHYTKLVLNRRIFDNPLPHVEIVDMREELKKGNRGMISFALKKAIEENLQRGQQSLILLNRRGYSTFIMCRSCGEVINCKNCDVPLKYHQKGESIRCHYCGYHGMPPRICPACNSKYIRYFGGGTQKLEEEIKRLFPDISVARLDMDLAKKEGYQENIFASFERGDIKILLGTQMIAKGHDFPGLSLVGIVSADASLNFPDFRAGERTFALLVQAGGRAGRRKKRGQVIIQTYNPESKAIICAKDHGVDDFMKYELETREFLKYPPFSSLIRIIFRGPKREIVENNAQDFADILRQEKNGALFGDILGPTEDLKIRSQYYYTVTIKTKNWCQIRPEFKKILGAFRKKCPATISLFMEVD